MAFQNFKPTVWSGTILGNLDAKTIAKDLITFKWAEDGAKTVTINQFGAVTVSDYTGTVDYEEGQGTDFVIPLNTAKSFAVAVDDVDAAQTDKDLMKGLTERAGYAMAEEFDKHVFGKMVADADPSVVKEVVVSAENAYDVLIDMRVALMERNINPTWVVVPAKVEGYLLKDARFISLRGDMATKEIGNVAGIKVYVSNLLPTDSIIMGFEESVAGGMLIDKTEALRLQNSFKDAVRGLQLFGVETVKDGGALKSKRVQIVNLGA